MSGMSIMTLIVLAMLIAFLLGVLFMWLWRRCCAEDHHGTEASDAHDAWRVRLTAAEEHREQLRRQLAAREAELAQVKASLNASSAAPAAPLAAAAAGHVNTAAADEANLLRARLALAENELRRLRAANAALSANASVAASKPAAIAASAAAAAPSSNTNALGTIMGTSAAVSAAEATAPAAMGDARVSTSAGPAKTGRWVSGRWVYDGEVASTSTATTGSTSTTTNAPDPETLKLAGNADDDADTVIDAVLDSPQSAEEIEGLKLIQDSSFVATDANRPASLLASANDGPADDLELIKGVGPKLNKMLNDLGIFYFHQVGNFSAQDIAWVNAKLTEFKGRIVRDRWVPQGRIFAARKRAGHMIIGKKGLWTLPPASAGDAATRAAIAALPVSAAEEEALKLMEAGFEATDANRPASLLASRPAQIDDLKDIKGVAEKLEALLHSLGIYTFRQVANFSATDIAWVDTKLKFRGRIVRDRWVAQARALHKAKYGTDA